MAATSLTHHLAIAMGLYLVAAGIFGFSNRDHWMAIMTDLRKSPALIFVSGIFVFALGVALILTHNNWSGLLAGTVSLFGWGAAVEGLTLIAAPKVLLDFADGIAKPGTIKIFMIFALGLGGLLLAGGLLGL